MLFFGLEICEPVNIVHIQTKGLYIILGFSRQSSKMPPTWLRFNFRSIWKTKDAHWLWNEEQWRTGAAGARSRPAAAAAAAASAKNGVRPASVYNMATSLPASLHSSSAIFPGFLLKPNELYLDSWLNRDCSFFGDCNGSVLALSLVLIHTDAFFFPLSGLSLVFCLYTRSSCLIYGQLWWENYGYIML